ncbi:DUF1648 domain-containing protein [Sporosarcina sp. Marseille-Q4063]|uniref:DUF1648 domain-containing protein n=1 Tax=Sporosarcina sp. Marseille-Q4063 TaxID=2810514 RepID=UPI001BAF8BA3|nr:DUF1648 domain-containing protein [Sporosarcina sp. Marseille-Q4063]QUW20267.1 DUF1648 domain-containing protein [Sporosarcina sp. Marseille-Q4063]
MNNRPILNLKITPLELFLNVITLAAFVGTIVYLISSWTIIPSEIPAHYNAAGEVNRWGSKGEILILPITALLMWIGMTFLEKFPHVYNYMNLTKDNARAQYLNGRLLVNVLKNECVLLFSYLTWKGIQVAIGEHDSLGAWSSPVFLLIIFGSMVYFIMKSVRLSKD